MHYPLDISASFTRANSDSSLFSVVVECLSALRNERGVPLIEVTQCHILDEFTPEHSTEEVWTAVIKARSLLNATELRPRVTRMIQAQSGGKGMLKSLSIVDAA